ncbi:MAG: hypothetical protein LLF89_10930 [Spirochaetaceae bacterium]|nr:hypothetical protein [Spirochaetaceae bacterium]
MKMKALLKRIYRGIKTIPIIGAIAQKLVSVIRARRNSAIQKARRAGPAAADIPTVQKGALVTQLNSLADRIAVLEQIKPAMNNYVASWADTVSLMRQEQEKLKAEVGRLSAIVEAQSRDGGEK